MPARTLAIVVADDVEAITSVVQQCLGALGHVVTCVGSGRELLKAVRAQAFDLAIVDIVMPDGDGHDAIAALSRLHPGLRIVAMSGGGRLMPTDPGLRIAKGLGADALLPKPFSRTQLMTAIEKAMAGAA